MRVVCWILTISSIANTAGALSRSRIVQQPPTRGYENRRWQRLQQSMVSMDKSHQSIVETSSTTTVIDSLTESSADNAWLLPQIRYDDRKRHNTATTMLSTVITTTVAVVVLLVATATTSFAGSAFADEYGVEKDAPTLFTGETVEICTKRGPLGACLKTEMRTSENENDISKKYFRDPLAQQKVTVLQKPEQDSDDDNILIQKLRQQSIDNREKNDLYVARKTFEADQSATFGPFDRQVLIMNTDGKTYTLLENPVAMRLKKAGFINDRRAFITQPKQEDLDAASEKQPGLFSNLF